MSSTGGLSNEEFLVIQEQLIALRNKNYELQEALRKKDHEISQLSSPRSEALQFANKLINRYEGNKEKDVSQKYEVQLDALRMKLTSQEEEFRLQQETLISELNKIVVQNETLNKELEQIKANGSIYSSPQAGTPCESQPPTVDVSQTVTVGELPTAAATSLKSSVGTQCDGAGAAEQNSSSSEPKSCQTDEGAIVPALENQLLEYGETITELRTSLEELSSRNEILSSMVQEKGARIASLESELMSSTASLAEKDDLISHLLRSMSTLKEITGQGSILFSECADVDLLDKEISLILDCISNDRAAVVQISDEKTGVEELLSAAKAQAEALQAKFTQMEETHEAERTRAKEEINSLSTKLLRMQEDHDTEVEAIRRESTVTCDELRAKVAALEESGSKLTEDRILVLENRFQLELSDREKMYEIEKEEMQRKISSLEASLSAKDEEKVLALKKQAALVKELQRAVREEKKRAESMEKLGRCCSEERGWHLVGETDAKSAHTLDGVDSRSVSSASALESDNFELISRLTSLQRTHAEALDRINALENENARLNSEISEKSELIEHWIRRRPLATSTGVTTPSKTEGAFRKLLSTFPTDGATNDIKEMNKKLQRMLEETLSKNIILQRDLQTLLERTEM